MDFQAFTQTAPDVYASLSGVSKAVTASGMDKALTELVKLRVSQINGCAFCLQFHLNIARKLDIDPRKFDLLAGWRDAGIYSGREMAALGWAEALTQLTDPQARDAALDKARAEFDEKELVFLAATVASINAWNRIAVGLHFPPPAAEANRSPA
ncbi:MULTISPECIES: carboxymuconolactone decarboxylase family protein [unclassified Cupriavidus]|uniref:carboxymuconolactone decarboxylase family protein n=1 Tax=unclassified Cupriavidus TaxID=2640874 RepID=UPI001C006D3A|nr:MULTISPECIES: carboxymuconolactone decarboxylase family protein [unclassified Cupriavidus]MCA3184821.1 carboxymuconolactone decarboxylase family protein [Cupriavidus sp.]MCA3193372.1 carboxymuconolactone decarboxylase family protein [Cupriavidus sp.]MCA3198174.1 carboxymuconolactone decarboxylase family protein [Cupriavidus sp.]MCA3204941.1 carboxymuconolactone decarboxylase family protein [Cupriavidus sp.]MCA3208608.1 carboxymuconolactone decarboxylase family protein [Cupriavidus sp.]